MSGADHGGNETVRGERKKERERQARAEAALADVRRRSEFCHGPRVARKKAA
jgi:hypothetical protein